MKTSDKMYKFLLNSSINNKSELPFFYESVKHLKIRLNTTLTHAYWLYVENYLKEDLFHVCGKNGTNDYTEIGHFIDFSDAKSVLYQCVRGYISYCGKIIYQY